MEKAEQTIQHVEPPRVLTDAQHATRQEHQLSTRQAIKLYRKAIGWSMVMSMALIMDGYDLKLIASLFAQPAFQSSYGECDAKGSCQISAPWQAGLTNGSNVGQLIGLAISGYVCEKFGFRKTMMAALCIASGIIFIQFFAPNLPVLETGNILLGIPLGMFQTITCVYAVEVMPLQLRAYLTSYVNMCWLIGQFIASAVLRGTLSMAAPWAYRVPFALQWCWPIPIFIGAFLAPESPWWLIRQNRLDDAKTSIQRLTSPQDDKFDVDRAVALIALTTEHERRLNSETHYIACFKGIDLRRTIIVISCYCMQVISGTTLRSYATYFLQQAGLPTDQAFNMSIVNYALGLMAVMCSWVLMSRVGRRTLFMYGLGCLTVLYCIIGGIGVPQATHPSSNFAWVIGSLLVVSTFIANSSVGSVSYALVSEIPSSLLRSKSVVIARFSYAVVNICANVLTPYQLNPTAWGWGAKTAFFWAIACTMGFLLTYFYIPEPKGRTVAELDLLFERKIPARKFAITEVSVLEMHDGGKRSG